MTIATAILLSLLITAAIIGLVLGGFNWKDRKGRKAPHGHNTEPVKIFYPDADFQNKQCTELSGFVINENIDAHDLRRLTDLNGIRLQISEGWYPLTIELIKELYANGWDKKVTCIKEKYAALTVYIDTAYNSPLQKILNKYEKLSKHVCETCGGKGQVRHTGWEYVACRKHYLEDRGHIDLLDGGFSYNNVFYKWNDIKDAVFEDADMHHQYRLLRITFKNGKDLLVWKRAIGFGGLIRSLPTSLPGLNYNYVSANYHLPIFCEACGYKAVYGEECECCESDSWKGWQQKWKEHDSEESRLYHIQYCQMEWAADEGDIYEQQQHNYLKNPDHRILFSDEDMRAFLEDDD